MSTISCDHFPLLTADGPTQMAADEAMLEQAIATSRPALRFYTWDPPTLSLGYFQPFANRLAGLPVVRRITGGGAIVHHHELTYALVLPSGLAHDGRQWTCRMHNIIREALASLGIAAANGCSVEFGRGAFLCFEHQTPGDMLIAGHKIGGSAQRRRAGAILQHGSILLATSPHARQLLGISELIGSLDIGLPELAVAIADCVARETGWQLKPTNFTGAIRNRFEGLTEKYRDPSWTERR
jgi:lipoate-protein ligase A